jgi:FemAB-related protein (PEP-CTERM system-associated)
MARKGDEVAGILPLTLVASRLFGRILCSLPFVNFGGPCAESADVASQLVAHAREYARRNSIDRVELRCTRPVNAGVEPSTGKVSMTVRLVPDPERLWMQFTSKHRNNVRRAQKNNLSVEAGRFDLLDDFYSVMERSWRELGTPLYSRCYFEQVLSAFPAEIRIFVCRYRGRPVAAALNAYADGVVEGLWNGSIGESRNLYPNYALYWEMIRDACIGGFARFHLGRSTAASGAEEFKSRWNAERRQLYWYAWSPDGGAADRIAADNPRYRLAITAWRRLPLVVTRLVGPRLARCIP